MTKRRKYIPWNHELAVLSVEGEVLEVHFAFDLHGGVGVVGDGSILTDGDAAHRVVDGILFELDHVVDEDIRAPQKAF